MFYSLFTIGNILTKVTPKSSGNKQPFSSDNACQITTCVNVLKLVLHRKQLHGQLFKFLILRLNDRLIGYFPKWVMSELFRTVNSRWEYAITAVKRLSQNYWPTAQLCVPIQSSIPSWVTYSLFKCRVDCSDRSFLRTYSWWRTVC